jgi:hypothetical protein
MLIHRGYMKYLEHFQLTGAEDIECHRLTEKDLWRKGNQISEVRLSHHSYEEIQAPPSKRRSFLQMMSQRA